MLKSIWKISCVPAVLALIPSLLYAAPGCHGLETSSSPTVVVDAQIAAYNAHDVEGFATCYSDDVEITDLAGKIPPIKGQAALVKTYAFLKRVPQAFGVEIVHRIVNGPMVIDQEHVVGLPPDKHKPDQVAVYEVRGGRIVKAWFPPAE
ncbi:nuclear transport factor 2 family protein [Dyella subtropica]|uniref:nuclear transport factor 2 family protein n=1 Tax=Dyella subtropica TaxID=2992127 RepID=UPI00224F10CA|nr:nuclear transport factor 2 family protein [Dyella subtropica]